MARAAGQAKAVAAVATLAAVATVGPAIAPAAAVARVTQAAKPTAPGKGNGANAAAANAVNARHRSPVEGISLLLEANGGVFGCLPGEAAAPDRLVVDKPHRGQRDLATVDQQASPEPGAAPGPRFAVLSGGEAMGHGEVTQGDIPRFHHQHAVGPLAAEQVIAIADQNQAASNRGQGAVEGNGAADSGQGNQIVLGGLVGHR